MTAQRSPTYFTFTWWRMRKVECSVGYTRVLYQPHHHLKKHANGGMFRWLHQGHLLTLASLDDVKDRMFRPADHAINWRSMWIPALSPAQSHLNKRNTTLDIYYWQQNLWTWSLILITQFHLKGQMAGSNQWVLLHMQITNSLFF